MTDATIERRKKLLGAATGTEWAWDGERFSTTLPDGSVREAIKYDREWVGVARRFVPSGHTCTGAQSFPSLKQLCEALSS